jgi:hypothetical protein
VAKFKYLGIRLTGQSYIYEEIKEEIKIGECLLPLSTQSFIPFWCKDDNMIVSAVWCE